MDHLLELVWAEGDFEYTLTSALLVAIFTYGHLAHLLRAEGRRKHRLYLCRPELLPNPRIGSSWQSLYQSQTDRAFITTMGIDTRTFQVILNAGFEHLWNSTPIPRTDTNINGEPRLGARSLDAAGGLGLYLHYLRSSMREVGLCQEPTFTDDFKLYFSVQLPTFPHSSLFSHDHSSSKQDKTIHWRHKYMVNKA